MQRGKVSHEGLLVYRTAVQTGNVQHKAASTWGTGVVQREILQRQLRPLKGFLEEACALRAKRGIANDNTAEETCGWGWWFDDMNKGRLECAEWMAGNQAEPDAG